MTSAFNPEQFLGTNNKGPLDTRMPLPKPGSAVGQISKIVPRLNMGADKSTHILDFIWDVMDDEQKKTLGVDRLTARQSVFVDLTPEGALDTSPYKSVQLGRLQENLGFNNKGEWSLAQMVGQMGKIEINHRPDPSPEKAGVVYAEVAKVAKFS